ncbi:cation:proton antiporter [Saliphagus infecundisoli]|uniref:Cation:proton antiporter n=1 Tax=Saliphagus infecundisoli TaxID=1849069 RepID=A0ABD5QCP5_9EURY
MVSIEQHLITLLYLLALATVVGVLTERYPRIQNTTGLLLIGIAVSAVGSPIEVELTSELILLIVLPALVFNDAVNIDVRAFRDNFGSILSRSHRVRVSVCLESVCNTSKQTTS